MPISEIDGCQPSHWKEVLHIIKDVINEIGFTPNLVSDSGDSGVIQKRIIQNLYDNPIVVCDVSGKNPNVMFELGMRLAFDKPTVIIKDDQTSFSFDTAIIEHLIYPRDLRFSSILNFKNELKSKIENTHKSSIEDKNYSTFLKHFGKFKLASIDEVELSSDKFILRELRVLHEKVDHLLDNKTFRETFEDSHMVSIDFSDFTKWKSHVDYNLTDYKDFRVFLDTIYFDLDEYLSPFTYEFDWILIDKASGDSFLSKRAEQGAEKGKAFTDFRTLEEVGIFSGMYLKVKRLHE